MSESERIKKIIEGHASAESRWARFGPYYAMFPMQFALNTVSKYSKPGDFVLDPFAGRGSSLFAAAALGRRAYGVEINPVGWLYSTVKLQPAAKEDVEKRLQEIVDISKRRQYIDLAGHADEFFKMCFSRKVLSFLCAARELLNWENNRVDATLMAFVLLYLHGKRNSSLSNQMPMTKATSKNYSIEWWKKEHLETPPEIEIYSFMQKRIRWRYGKGVPSLSDAQVDYDDCTTRLPNVLERDQPIGLLLTSPPYYGVTNYFVDQWLRLWMLQGPTSPTILTEERYKKRFDSKEDYTELLDSTFRTCAPIMAPKSTIYVRTDSRDYTLTATREILKKYFPNYSYTEKRSVCKSKSQTELLNNSSTKPREVDIILRS